MDTGIMAAQFQLNKLHRKLADQGFDQVITHNVTWCVVCIHVHVHVRLFTLCVCVCVCVCVCIGVRGPSDGGDSCRDASLPLHPPVGHPHGPHYLQPPPALGSSNTEQPKHALRARPPSHRPGTSQRDYARGSAPEEGRKRGGVSEVGARDQRTHSPSRGHEDGYFVG